MNVKFNKKRVAILAVVVVAIVVGVVVYQALGKEDEPEYRTAKVERGMIISSVSTSGRITGAGSVSLTTQATGVIKKIYVKDGDFVETGDKLFELTLDSDGKLAKAKAWASYLGAKNEVESAKQNKLATSRDLTSANIDLTSAEQSKQSLQREITLAQSSMDAAQTAYDDAASAAAGGSELRQKSLSLRAARDALALAELKYDNSLSANSVTAEQNLLSLKRELELAEVSVLSAHDAYDAVKDDTSTPSSIVLQKELAWKAAQNAVALAQSKYDNAESNNSASTDQTKLSLQREVTLAESSLAAAEDAYDKAVRSTASQSEIKQKELGLKAAQDALALAQDRYDSSDMSIDRAGIGVSIAKQKAGSDNSAIARAVANLEAAKLAYEATLPTVKAPVSGTIGDITLVPGMTIGGSSSSAGSSAATGNGTAGATTSSNKLATIVAGEFATAEFSLTEMDIVKVKKGQKATITVDALTDKSFTGKVIGIDKSGSVSSGVTTYPITIQITTQSDEILPNMAATASIITETKDNVLIIPAGVTQTVGTQAAVTLLKDKKTQQVPVQLGLASENTVEVLSGLAEGDEIVIATISGQQ
ncbi:MAG TPA: hypothetical protein DE036_09615, partial [Actinobacteria bacterium]|nr:hypothetical protein [Actinomycetota bacterium]